MKGESELLSRPIDVSSIPQDGMDIVVTATEQELRAVAKTYGFLDVRGLAADLRARVSASGIVTISGRLRAELVQSCVVSLEPVEERIDEPVSTRFVPESFEVAGEPVAGVGDTSDADETFSGTAVDVGRFVLDEFLLSVDPYPRAPGAVLPSDVADPAPDSPFAALSRLKRDDH